jgi:spore germination protein YaaH
MKKIRQAVIGAQCALGLAATLLAAQHEPQALFYMTRSANSERSFEEHASQINAIVPTWYSVERDGRLIGHPEPAVLSIAKEHQVQVMPIVSAWDFHPKTYHAFLSDRVARHRFGRALVEACRRYGYAGFQIDFEDINFSDRAALSSTVAEVAGVLHHAGYELSMATVPNAPGLGPPTAFDQWLYHHWGGVYDLRVLAKSVDWICLMTYDEHTRFTPPGPVAGYPWVVRQLDYALEQVPKQKLSLGISLYGYRWWAGKPRRLRVGNRRRYEPNVEAKSLSAPAALRLAVEFHRPIRWDARDETAWFDFYRGGRREWVFFTNGRTFARLLHLARKRRLKGFCAWVLGDEDPTIWKYLPAH